MPLQLEHLFDIRDGNRLAGAVVRNRLGAPVAIGVPGRFAVMCRKRFERDPDAVAKVERLMGTAVRLTKSNGGMRF